MTTTPQTSSTFVNRNTGKPSSAPQTSVTAQPSVSTQATVPPPPASAAPAPATPASPLPTGADYLHRCLWTATDPAKRLHPVVDHRYTELPVRGRFDRGVQLAAVEQAQLQDHHQRRQGVVVEREQPTADELLIEPRRGGLRARRCRRLDCQGRRYRLLEPLGRRLLSASAKSRTNPPRILQVSGGMFV